MLKGAIMSSEEYTLMLEILKKLEDRFKTVTEKQLEFKNKLQKTIDKTEKSKSVQDLKIFLF